MYPMMKVRESVGRSAKLAVRPRKFATHKNTRDLIKLNKYWRVDQWFKSLGDTPITGFHTWHLHVRESVKTRVMGMRSLISCMT